MTKELKVIEVPSSGKPSWLGGAFCIVFVYSKHQGNFILKGYMDEVDDYLKNNFTHYFANYTLWSSNGHRSIWKFWKQGYYISDPDRKRFRTKTDYKWVVTNFGSETGKVRLEFRRMPKRWIPEFDNLK